MHPTRSLRGALRSAFRRLRASSSDETRSKELGQVLPMFAIMAIVVLGGAALLTDVAWWWTNEQRMQRAADAASLAGAVYLPADEVKAFASAQDAALKNGFTNGVGGVVVAPRRDPDNPRKLIVDIDGPVRTNFARVFCWNGGPCLNSVSVGVTGAAEFVLPVPMGSPENYYGVFGSTRGLTSSAMVATNHTDPGWSCGSGDTWSASSGCTARVPTQTAAPNNWTASSTSGGNNLANSLSTNNNVYGRTSTDGSEQGWTGFSAQTGVPNPGTGESVDIVGIDVRLSDAWIDTACAGTGSPTAWLGVHLSWDNGTNWTSDLRVPATGSLGTSTSNGDYVVGGAVNIPTSVWGAHNWTRAELANMQIHIMAHENCTGTKQFNVDMADVRIKWNYSYTTTALQTTNLTDKLLEGP
ncbi:MAG TPA: pilus assembly protein TadG-related protein, partial [Vicinamibacterales bacterium]